MVPAREGTSAGEVVPTGVRAGQREKEKGAREDAST